MMPANEPRSGAITVARGVSPGVHMEDAI